MESAVRAAHDDLVAFESATGFGVGKKKTNGSLLLLSFCPSAQIHSQSLFRMRHGQKPLAAR